MSSSVAGIARSSGIGRLLQHVEAAHFVQAHDVIGVAVREEDRVDPADAVGQRLRAEVGSGIDEHAGPVVGIDVDRGAQPVSRGSVERQVAHSQPIIGTPCDVPVPRNVTRSGVK